MSEKLYYVVRKDLTHAQRAVQLIHAREQWMVEAGSAGLEDEAVVKTAVVFAVKDEATLVALYRKLYYERGSRIVDFCEPDLGDEMTAFCTNSPVGLEGLTLL